MKCKYCSWRGTFEQYGSHMAKKHRRILIKNLKKARRAPRSHEGRKSKSKRKSRRSSSHSVTADLPDAPDGFVVETVTYRRT